MARLIDADAFIKEQCNSCDGYCEKVDCDCLNCDSDCRCDMIKDLLDAPTISPGEVRCVGKWERYEKENPNARRCSRCKNCYVNADQPKSLWKFCPECGAHMEVRE